MKITVLIAYTDNYLYGNRIMEVAGAVPEHVSVHEAMDILEVGLPPDGYHYQVEYHELVYPRSSK